MSQFLEVLGARQQTLKSPWWEGSMLAKSILAKGLDADGENVANCCLCSAAKSLRAVVSDACLQNNMVTLTLRASYSRCLLAWWQAALFRFDRIKSLCRLWCRRCRRLRTRFRLLAQ